MKVKFLILLLLTFLSLVACEEANDQQNDMAAVSSDEPVESKEAIEEKTEIPKEDIEEKIEIPEEAQDDPLLNLFADDPVPQKGGTINSEQVKAIIEYHALGDDDRLVEALLHNGEISVTIEVGDSNDLPAEMSAESIYSNSGDELLLHEGWEILTINFVNIGTVSMNRSQKKDDGFGPYFSNADIIKQLEK